MDLPSDMECTVCHGHFDRPKLLPCGHLLCRDCLVAWLKSQPEANCPLCRCAIVAADPAAAEADERKGFEDKVEEEIIADSFPTDSAMAALVVAARRLSEESQCCVCEQVAAVSVCLDCDDLFCGSCSAVHRKQSATRGHEVRDLTGLTATTLAAHRVGTCPDHPCLRSDLYCPSHDVCVCQSCAVTDHRRCPDVTRLAAKMAETRAVLADLVRSLSEGEAELERSVQLLDQNLRDSERHARDALARIEELCDRLDSAVKACRRRLEELALSQRDEVKAVTQERKTQLLRRRGKLTSHKVVAMRVQEMAVPDCFDSMATVLTARVHDLDRSSTLPDDFKVVSVAGFTIDLEIVSSIEEKLSSLGQVMRVPVDAPPARTYAEVRQLSVSCSTQKLDPFVQA